MGLKQSFPVYTKNVKEGGKVNTELFQLNNLILCTPKITTEYCLSLSIERVFFQRFEIQKFINEHW